MTDDLLVFPTSLGDPGDHLLGNDQGVNGGLWRNVTNGDTGFILVKDVGRNFPVDDFFKRVGMIRCGRLRLEIGLLGCPVSQGEE